MPERCRIDAGFYLDLIQEGVLLFMPLSRRMRTIGPRVRELRLSDGPVDWRVVYRIDTDVILAVDSFRKTTARTPDHVIARCRVRLARFDAISSRECPMTPERRAKLEAAGYSPTTPADSLGLDEIERKVVAFRVELARAVRRLRGERGLTQEDLAAIVQISQSRMPAIEKGEKVSIESILKAYIAAGGELPTFAPPESPADPALETPRPLGTRRKRSRFAKLRLRRTRRSAR